jgi:hypothetical protein
MKRTYLLLIALLAAPVAAFADPCSELTAAYQSKMSLVQSEKTAALAYVTDPAEIAAIEAAFLAQMAQLEAELASLRLSMGCDGTGTNDGGGGGDDDGVVDDDDGVVDDDDDTVGDGGGNGTTNRCADLKTDLRARLASGEITRHQLVREAFAAGCVGGVGETEGKELGFRKHETTNTINTRGPGKARKHGKK